MLGKVELEEGEAIILEALASCKLGPIIQYGTGQAYLTNRRIIWISGIPSLLLMLIPWIPAVMQIRRNRISRLQLVEDWTRAWLVVEADSKAYTLRLGVGPAPLLQRNPETTRQWHEILRENDARAGEGASDG